jgi:hypothetical protein
MDLLEMPVDFFFGVEDFAAFRTHVLPRSGFGGASASIYRLTH